MVSIKLILKAVAPTISLMILIALNGIGSAQVVEKNSEDLINEAIILNGEIINLKEQYKNILKTSKPEIMRAMAKDPVLVLNGARLLGKYSPAIENFNQEKNDGNLITKQDVKEIVSFSNRLEKRIMEDRDKRGIKSSKKSIECLDEFRKEVEKSKGKTFVTNFLKNSRKLFCYISLGLRFSPDFTKIWDPTRPYPKYHSSSLTVRITGISRPDLITSLQALASRCGSMDASPRISGLENTSLVPASINIPLKA